MDLDLAQEQEMLRATARGLLAEHCPIEVVRRLEDDPTGYPAPLWKQLAELGLVGMLLPEAHGGSGQSLLEGAILYEELGRVLAPTPHFASAVMAGGVLAAVGSEAQRAEWLPGIARGEVLVVPAWIEPGRSQGARGVALRAEPAEGGFRLHGVKRHVPFAAAATRLLVLARTGGAERDVDLFLVDPGAEGVSLVQQRAMASDAQYQVSLEGARVSEAQRVGPPGGGWDAFEAALLDGIVLLAAQAIGGAARALEITVDYAKERRQFDTPIGAFQSIAHYLADAATRIDGGRALVHEAAWARSRGLSTARLAPMAKLFACETFRETTAMCQQVWGGVGFTIEYDIQLFFRRAKQLELSWWDARVLEERIAASALGPAE